MLQPLSVLAMLGLIAGFSAYAQAPSKEPRDIAREAERAEASAARELSTRNDDLITEVLPDGTRMVDLQGRFQMQTSVVRMPDGSLKTVCHSESEDPLHVHADGAEHAILAEDESR